MTRWRRPGADEVLLAYLLLAAVGPTLNGLSHSLSWQHPLSEFLLTAFLTWRVSRGGRISRALLIIGSVLDCAAAVLAVARLWDPSIMALVIIFAVQVELLLSPPVYWCTRRPAPILVRARSWPQLIGRSPWWLLPVALFAGVAVTLACLGNSDWVAIPGCRPAASDACTALAEGYPLRWLTAMQNMPEISKGALLKDCTQWALASALLLHVLFLRRIPSANLSD
ncbi:MAG TPA: hypothetical protein VN714_16975 [Trebonia sp.]|jgi:hypothetical protein|nr:hypothetical protein [Trebonia sp.]